MKCVRENKAFTGETHAAEIVKWEASMALESSAPLLTSVVVCAGTL
jgi:hypothetical protein